jgi:chromosome segregation ATPase
MHAEETGEQDENNTTVADLQEQLESLEQDYRSTMDHVIEPLKDARDEAQAERDALADEVARLEDALQRTQARVDSLEDQLENIIGISEDEKTTHKKRVTDIRLALKRQAEGRSGNGAGKAAMDRLDIADRLYELNHGSDWADAQLIRIIEDAAQETGYSMTEDYINRNGNEVKAVRVNLAALAESTAANDVSSSGAARADGGARSNGGEHNSG